MRKSSRASAGSLLPCLRQDTVRQCIFIKAQAPSCSRELGFNVFMGSHFQWRSWNLQFNWGDLDGSASVNEQGESAAWIKIEITLHTLLYFIYSFLEALSCGFFLLIFCYSYCPFSSFRYSLLLFIQHMYVRRRNSFLEVGAIPSKPMTFSTLSHKSPSANRWEGVWCY